MKTAIAFATLVMMIGPMAHAWRPGGCNCEHQPMDPFEAQMTMAFQVVADHNVSELHRIQEILRRTHGLQYRLFSDRPFYTDDGYECTRSEFGSSQPITVYCSHSWTGDSFIMKGISASDHSHRLPRNR